MPHPDLISRDEMKRLIEEAVDRSVKKAFHDAGLALSEEDHVMEARKDFMFLRSTRQRVDGAAGAIGKAVLMAVIAALLGALGLGLRATLGE